MNYKTKISITEFKEKYLTTLHKDPKVSELHPDPKPYIKIELDDYTHLAILQNNLVHALRLIFEGMDATEKNGKTDTEVQCSALAIIEILAQLDLYSEMEGIDRLIKEDN